MSSEFFHWTRVHSWTCVQIWPCPVKKFTGHKPCPFTKSSDSREMYTHRKNGEVLKSSEHISLGPTVSQKSNQNSGSMSTQSKSTKPNRDKKLSNSKGTKGLKRPNLSVENTFQL